MSYLYFNAAANFHIYASCVWRSGKIREKRCTIFFVHDLVCRNHIDRSGPPAGETRTSTTSRHFVANIYSENMTNVETLPFSPCFYDDQKTVVSPANVVILVSDHHSATSPLLLASANVQESNWLQSRTFWGIFSVNGTKISHKYSHMPPGMHHFCHEFAGDVSSLE